MIRRFFGAVAAELKSFRTQLALYPVVVFLVAGVALWAYDGYGSSEFFYATIAPHLGLSQANQELCSYLYWFYAAFVLLLAFPMAAHRIARRFDPAHAAPTLGWTLGDRAIGKPITILFLSVMLPIVAVCALLPSFQSYYPIYTMADRSWTIFLLYEASYAIYFLAWDWFFRGFLTLGLEKQLGVWAIFVQMLPFLYAHLGKPGLESLSSIAGAIALGWLAWRTRSAWYGVMVHAVTAVSLDLFVVGYRHLGWVHG